VQAVAWDGAKLAVEYVSAIRLFGDLDLLECRVLQIDDRTEPDATEVREP